MLNSPSPREDVKVNRVPRRIWNLLRMFASIFKGVLSNNILCKCMLERSLIKFSDKIQIKKSLCKIQIQIIVPKHENHFS